MSRQRPALKFALGFFAAATFLFATVASAAPLLHHALHSDAADAQHECVLTIFSAGKLTVPPITSLALPPAELQIPCLPSGHRESVPELFSGAHLLEHAPPVFLGA